MSVFHHDNIYLTWLNLKANNLSTLNYPHHGETIGINNSIQLSDVESDRDAPASRQGHQARPHHGPASPGFDWWYLQIADCPQAFRSSYISSSRTFCSLHKERRVCFGSTGPAWVVQWCFCTIIPGHFPFSAVSVMPRERRTMRNYKQHVCGPRKQTWDKHDPGLDPASSCLGHVHSLPQIPRMWSSLPPRAVEGWRWTSTQYLAWALFN